MRKKKIIAPRVSMSTEEMSLPSKASGNKCKKAPPSKAPADKETRYMSKLATLCWFINKTTAPEKANALIKIPAKIVGKNAVTELY